MMKRLHLIVLILISISACLTMSCDDIHCLPDTECPAIIENNTLYEQSPEDEYFLDTLWIEGDFMHIGVRYGGGCGEAFFKLITPGNLFQPQPPVVMVKLSLDDRDWCEALVYEELCYDLSLLQKWDSNKVDIRLKGIDETWEYQY